MQSYNKCKKIQNQALKKLFVLVIGLFIFPLSFYFYSIYEPWVFAVVAEYFIVAFFYVWSLL